MLEKLKTHSVKIFVFVINILLTLVAVLVIREKDQARLLENAQNENPANAVDGTLPSFENSVSSNALEKTNSEENISPPADAPIQPLPTDSGTVVPAAPGQTAPTPSVISPAPAQNAASSNAKTKTS